MSNQKGTREKAFQLCDSLHSCHSPKRVLFAAQKHPANTQQPHVQSCAGAGQSTGCARATGQGCGLSRAWSAAEGGQLSSEPEKRVPAHQGASIPAWAFIRCLEEFSA